MIDGRGAKQRPRPAGNSSKNCVDQWVSCLAPRRFRWVPTRIQKPARLFLSSAGAEERIKVRRWENFVVIFWAAGNPDATPHLYPLPFTKGRGNKPRAPITLLDPLEMPMGFVCPRNVCWPFTAQFSYPFCGR